MGRLGWPEPPLSQIYDGAHSEISLESSEDVGVGVVLGGVNNHIKECMLYPLKDQRVLPISGSLI